MGEGLSDRSYDRLDMVGEMLDDLPGAAARFASEAWQDKSGTALRVVRCVGTSYLMGGLIGYVLPAGGPAGWAVGLAFTYPLVAHGYHALSQARDQANKPGANVDQVASALALETVSGAFDFGLTFLGGWAGAEGGHLAASGRGRLASPAQAAQRLILKGENEALRAVLRPGSKRALATGESAGLAPPSSPSGMSPLPAPVLHPGRGESGVLARERSLVDTRLDQYLGNAGEGRLYFGSLHGHSKYSDGMGTPAEIYARARSQGQHFTAITDHNHLAARDGVKPGDPRSPDQADVPIVAANPIEYSQTFADAWAATKDGEFVALVGTEMGTIGKVGGHHGGVNHINILEVPTFFEAIRQPRSKLDLLFDPLRKVFGIRKPPDVKPPDVIKYNDGDYKALVSHLDGLKDTTGGRPVVQLNHPRYSADESASLPAAVRGRDYGQKSFKSQAEWREKFGKYASQIEVIKGEALNPNPVDRVQAGDLDPHSFAGYLDKGLHLSPTFGRDFHFGDPGGNPAGTGILSTALDRASLLAALRERRTVATTSVKRLQGVLSANDSHPMGSILDQAAVPDLTLKMRIGGEVSADAAYTLRLFADSKIGDRKLAEAVQTLDLTGSELIARANQVAFEPIAHRLGNKSAYFVEVKRRDPQSGDTDHLWTAPIWVEPLSAAKHPFWLRALAGSAGDSALYGGS